MDTQSALLSSAEQMIRQRGFDAVSYGDLAREVGIKTASIHYHFPKKQDLAVSLLDHYSAKLTAARARIAQTTHTGGEAIGGLVSLYRDALDQGRQLCLCVAFSAGRDSLDAQALGRLAQFHDDSLRWLEEAFDRAGQDGSLQDVADPKDEASATLALLEGAQVMARAAGDLAPFDRATRSLLHRIT